MQGRRKVKGFSKYEVDEKGIVYGFRGKPKAVRIHHRQPEIIVIDDCKHRRHIAVARFVLQAWQPLDCDEGYEVHHKDKNRLNNAVYNLEWLTPDEHREKHVAMNREPMLAFGDYEVV